MIDRNVTSCRSLLWLYDMSNIHGQHTGGDVDIASETSRGWCEVESSLLNRLSCALNRWSALAAATSEARETLDQNRRLTTRTSKSASTPPSELYIYHKIVYDAQNKHQSLTSFTNPTPVVFTSSSRTASTDLCLDRFFWATRFFILFFPYFSVSRPCARLSWPSRQLLSSR